MVELAYQILKLVWIGAPFGDIKRGLSTHILVSVGAKSARMFNLSPEEDAYCQICEEQHLYINHYSVVDSKSWLSPHFAFELLFLSAFLKMAII